MLSATTPTQPHEYTEMSRLADYFVVVGYDHEKESESPLEIMSVASHYDCNQCFFFPDMYSAYFYYIEINDRYANYGDASRKVAKRNEKYT